jgi:4-amino-4-deoxy-L-arabinose transferase-like glycosyltransferase
MRRAIVFVAFVLFALQALPYFRHRWVEDESWYSIPATTLLRTGELRNPALPATDYESKVDTRPPLMPLSLAASFSLLGTNVAAARMGEFFAALLTLLIVYRIGSELGNVTAGALAALLLGVDTFFVLASRTARPEVWVALFSSCALLFALRQRTATDYLWVGVFLAAACNFHILGLAPAGAMFLLLVYQKRAGVMRSRQLWMLAAGFVIGVLPVAIWLTSSATNMEAARHMYGRSAGASLAETILKEGSRWADFIGISNQRLHLPFSIPLRLHIALAFLGAFAVLWYRNRNLFNIFAIATIPQLIWWMRLPNATARYYAVVAPLFALATAFALTSLTDRTRWFRVGIGIYIVCVISQVAGNLLILNQARKADYVSLSARLRQAVPLAHSCYAAMTFQFALYDYGCHSYDRTPFSYTAEIQRPEYLILGDRVMMAGSGRGEDDFREVRQMAFAFVERRGELTSEIDDPFYGHLKIFRVSYDSQLPAPNSQTAPSR